MGSHPLTSNSNLRVAVASSGLEHVRRGVEAWAHDLAAALAHRGVDVTLFKGSGPRRHRWERPLPCLRIGNRLTRWMVDLSPGWTWHIGMGSEVQLQEWSFTVSLLAAMGDQYDILHLQDANVAFLAQSAHDCGLLRSSVILGHGTNEPREFLSRFPHVQHLAPCYLEDARRQGWAKPLWTAIPNSVDTDRFQPQPDRSFLDSVNVPRSSVVVFTAAMISKEVKRIHYLVEAVHLARRTNPDIHLLVAGAPSSETDAVIALGKSLLGDHVTFLVDFPRDRMPELYKAADLFVLPSEIEMMPMALLEALASGLPAIVTDLPVLAWIVGDAGLAVPIHGPSDLVPPLLSLCDPDARRRLSPLARHRALQEFSVQAVSRQTLQYYHTVAKHPGES